MRGGIIMSNITCPTDALRKETFKKLFLLYVIGQFKKGVFGKKRLHKVVYIGERESDTKPFEFKKYHYGQYSDSMDEILDQLLAMGYVNATPLKTISLEHSGNKFELTDKDLARYYSVLLEKIDSDLKRKVDLAIKDYGYLPEPELVEKAYEFKEFIHARWEDIILDEQLPECLPAKDLADEDLEELEISLDPRFVNLMNQIDSAVEQGDFDPDKVKRVVKLV